MIHKLHFSTIILIFKKGKQTFYFFRPHILLGSHYFDQYLAYGVGHQITLDSYCFIDTNSVNTISHTCLYSSVRVHVYLVCILGKINSIPAHKRFYHYSISSKYDSYFQRGTSTRTFQVSFLLCVYLLNCFTICFRKFRIWKHDLALKSI